MLKTILIALLLIAPVFAQDDAAKKISADDRARILNAVQKVQSAAEVRRKAALAFEDADMAEKAANFEMTNVITQIREKYACQDCSIDILVSLKAKAVAEKKAEK